MADAFSEHWDAILEIQQETYALEIKFRAEARECRKLLREIESVTQPMMRVAPPRIEAVPSIPADRKQ